MQYNLLLKCRMNRKLILIANEGDERDYLPGVSIDMKNYHDFFIRPEGGAWNEDKEIHSFIDTSSATFLHDYIMMEIEFQKIEYFMIVFCGHGYVNANNDTVLCMKDRSEVTVSQLKTWVRYTPCTLIADCCRMKDIIDSAQLIEESLFSDSCVHLDGEACKLAYNRCLGLLPSGTFYEAYSTRIGETAGDTDTVGGVYSYNLLKRADEEKQRLLAGRLQNGDNVASLAQVHDEACPEVVKMRTGRQHPCRSENTDRVPFVVIA